MRLVEYLKRLKEPNPHVPGGVRREHGGRLLPLRRQCIYYAGETKFGTEAELKNINSFRFVQKAIRIRDQETEGPDNGKVAR